MYMYTNYYSQFGNISPTDQSVSKPCK